jgi:hypothetical protein
MTNKTVGRRRGEAAVQLRLAGTSYEEIATALSFASPRAARIAVERGLSLQLTGANRDEMREIQLRRLERMLRAVWAKALDPDSPEQMTAVRVGREIIDRICRLYGLDEPIEVLVHNPTTTEIENWIAAVLATGSTDIVEADVVGEITGPQVTTSA